jgi:hypothetical protein
VADTFFFPLTPFSFPQFVQQVRGQLLASPPRWEAFGIMKIF